MADIKVVKVHTISTQDIGVLEVNINNFCRENDISPERLIDIKLTESEKYYTAMIIYKGCYVKKV